MVAANCPVSDLICSAYDTPLGPRSVPPSLGPTSGPVAPWPQDRVPLVKKLAEALYLEARQSTGNRLVSR